LDFKEPEEASKARMKELCDHYKKMTLVDREEREKRRRASKKMMKPWSSMLDPAHSSKFASLTSPKSQVDTKLDPSAVSSEASSEVEPFPEDLYTTPVEIDTVTTIEQRLAYPSVQPTNVKDLWPRPFPLTAKRLRRCGKCDHMLCRAEYNPSSVRYKIQQIARLTVPQVKIRELPLPKPQEEYTFVLSITNPTSSVMKVSFEPEVSVDLPESRGGNLLKVMVPVGEFPISACDDVDVLDVSEDRSSLDPDQAKFLSGRGVGEIYLNFTTPPVQLDDDNQVMFTLNYSWSAADKSSEAKLLKAAVCVDLGKFLK
jgi:dynactin-4